MCKEDIRLARAAVPGAVTSQSANQGGTRFLVANVERYSLMAGLGVGIDNTSTNAVMVAAVIGGVTYPLIGLSDDHPVGTVNIVDVGSIITGEIWVYLLDISNQPDVFVAETKWNQSQESI